MIIDIFAHHISARVSEMIAGGVYARHYRYPPQNADPQVRLALMDRYGIDVQAVSQTTPVLMGLSPDEAAAVCRASNDDNDALCRAYPDRFVNIGMVSLLDLDEALRELDRCVGELGCRGITVSTNQEGRGLDDPAFRPFYKELVGYDLPLLLHPAHWGDYRLVDMDEGWRMMHVFGWPFDSTQAVWRLIMGGVIDEFPGLKVVVHHMGALLPYFEERIYSTFERHLKDRLPRHISEYWGNFYGDTAVDGTKAAYPCGYAFFGADRLVFGTDYPFGTESGEAYVRDNLSGVRAMGLPPEIEARVLSGNAARLLHLGS